VAAACCLADTTIASTMLRKADVGLAGEAANPTADIIAAMKREWCIADRVLGAVGHSADRRGPSSGCFFRAYPELSRHHS
jgi:hypothetical protein